jgi:hypothetical protein
MPPPRNAIALIVAFGVAGHAPATEAPGAAEPLKCDAGPVAKTFGNSQWLVYGCDDGRSVVVVSAPGNPAAPFYFMFSPSKGGYRLVGEGTGSKQSSAAALSELRELSASQVVALGAEARRGQQSAPR